MTNELTTETIHPFEKAGLGLAPFRFSHVTENVFVTPGLVGSTKAGGTCDFCSNGIRWEYWVKSADKKTFKVGCDCIAKLGRADNIMLSDMKRAKAKLAAEAREAKREAARLERNRLYGIELEAQRGRNGGLTDKEAREALALALAELAQCYAVENGWLISVLKSVGYASDFIDSMISKLETGPVSGMSPKCAEILRGVYAKTHGRRNSKAYSQAEDRFTDLAGL